MHGADETLGAGAVVPRVGGAMDRCDLVPVEPGGLSQAAIMA